MKEIEVSNSTGKTINKVSNQNGEAIVIVFTDDTFVCLTTYRHDDYYSTISDMCFDIMNYSIRNAAIMTGLVTEEDYQKALKEFTEKSNKEREEQEKQYLKILKEKYEKAALA